MTKLKPIDLAHYYLVNDLPGAHIHATRLYNILDSLQKGHPPTLYALSYLQKQGLVALSLFAQAEMTYEDFCESAAAEQTKHEQADIPHGDEAIALGTEAHTLTPKDFRPCTLLCAVNF